MLQRQPNSHVSRRPPLSQGTSCSLQPRHHFADAAAVGRLEPDAQQRATASPRKAIHMTHAGTAPSNPQHIHQTTDQTAAMLRYLMGLTVIFDLLFDVVISNSLQAFWLKKTKWTESWNSLLERNLFQTRCCQAHQAAATDLR